MADDKAKQGGEGEGDAGEDEDPRLNFIFNYLTKSYRLKFDKWSKMLNTDEYNKILMNFLDKPDPMFLIIYQTSSGLLITLTNFTKDIKAKFTYFIKKRKEAVTMDNFNDLILFGDMAGKPIDELSVLLDGVFLPILSNPANQQNWPKVVANDVVSHVKSFKNCVDQVKGAMKSQTILPMPQGMGNVFRAIEDYELSNGMDIDMQLKSGIETNVTKWWTICNEVLRQKSNSMFDEITNPVPKYEIEFWSGRLTNLESIYEQLRDPRVKKLAEYLEITKSTYSTTFKRLFKNIVCGIVEARDVCKHLKPLEKYFGRFEEVELIDNENFIKPIIHLIGLLWANSRYYATNERIAILFKQIANLLIEASERQIDPSSVFQGDPEDVHEKIGKTINVLQLFIDSFEYVRRNLENYFKKDTTMPALWTFDSRNVFQRLFDFIKRLRLLDSVLLVNLEFMKLEKIEFAGVKGKLLSQKCEEIRDQFVTTYAVFLNIQYDVCDLKDDQIIKDCANFMLVIDDFDKRLTALFSQSFEECSNLQSLCKFINIIGNLLERPSIYRSIKPHFMKITQLFNNELDSVKTLYDEGKEFGIPIDKNLPPVSGSLWWLFKLKQRITDANEDFKQIEDRIYNFEDRDYVVLKFDQLLEILVTEQKTIFNTWCETLPKQITISMEKFELNHLEDGLLQMNFDKELEAILREIKYILHLQIEDDALPDEALELFSKVELLYSCIMRYRRIIEWYNYLKTNTLYVEYFIIEPEIEEIDLLLYRAFSEITWATHDDDYLDTLFNKIRQLYDRVKESQNNLNMILQRIQSVVNAPVYTRKDGKKEQLLYLDDRTERLKNKYKQMIECSKETESLLEKNRRLLFNIPEEPPETERTAETVEKATTEPSSDDEKTARTGKKDKKKAKKKAKKAKKEKKEKKGGKRSARTEEAQQQEEELRNLQTAEEERRQQRWMNYLVYVSELIEDKITTGVLINFTYLLREMGDKKPVTPLFELLLELHEPNITFQPNINIQAANGWYQTIESLLQDTFSLAKYMKRVDKIPKPPEPEPAAVDVGTNTVEGAEVPAPEAPEPDALEEYDDEENYYNSIKSDPDCQKLFVEIMDRIIDAIDESIQYQNKFEQYSNLWLDDRQEYLKEFLTYGKVVVNLYGIEEEERKPCPPTIQQFKEQIDYYDNLYKEIHKMENEKLISGGWLRIDVRQLKQAILNIVCKWGNLFKQHLYSHVVDSLEELETFIAESIKVMQQPLTEDDYEGLLQVMGYLQKVKERQVETDNMFQPLKEIMDLLLEYGVEFPEEVHVQLQEIPDRWQQCKKVAATTKQLVAPLQALQINGIKRRINIFDIRQTIFRDAFKKMSFFNWNCPNVYPLLNKAHSELKQFEEELEKLTEQAILFDLQVPEFKQLKYSRREVCQIKQLWDYVNIINSYMDEWKTTPWKKIDVDNMEMECKKFAKDLRGMDKDLRGWDVYIQTEGCIKNMLTSLRAVTELQNPAIRERHWIQLMQATKVKFMMSDSTTLNDLLALNLHEYEDEVKNIVDKAIKEMAMEKVLKELHTTWSVLEFTTETHERTGLRLLVASEELIETLEENQVQLQNMMTSKFIDHFLGEISDWQSKLSYADQVIHVHFEVQRKWSYLESIFIGSEDIRNQLPEDSRRFERLDRDFKETLKEMLTGLNVIRATNKKGLYEKLENILSQLTLCEKALNEYLDTKRLAFPRFYFVSSADLLDILSNGNQPELIQRHLTKLFDSLAKLKFIQEGGRSTKSANGMISKENDEHVKFVGICDCTGKVENWLNRVIDIMRKTLHQTFKEAIFTYDDKPREVWIFDYPAQPALCGTQIWWTTEVNMALAKLEEGYESALKDYQRKQIAQLNALINLLLGDLSIGDRQKIMTICTIDVHSRDVVGKMIVAKVENAQAFQWQSQLRHRWDDKINNCFGNICDAEFLYQYEYLGNTPRLVITPLTDRCYITLTQSLHLIMGGAPAGPAGTGKTETTKDLGKALGVMVYVFNCSEQMDYKSIGNIYKGLAQTGCWGCFDEFNRISIEVLSVVAVQVKMIQDAIKDKKTKFFFLGEQIVLTPTVGIFITMNPGYAGRTELPENLKALFRPCAMVVPDFELICEIMLVAEGFQEARLLARKFITLYTLCRELLSKQDHYDWGLRAIKSVLVVAGSLRRGDRQRPEDQVLMRALRDFNIPKIITDDVAVFMGLIGDLFPALDVPRKRDMEFERTIKKSALDLKLQPEDGFVLKVVQLEELFAVRHSVFVIGNAGTGKSMVWKTLNRTYVNQKRKPYYNDLNPKAVTNDELFGIINPATREWKDGLFSIIMRDQANMSGDGPKWIVLDGDIDPMWIESLNTLMDDNKVLTLASNERIALTKSMRLLFEIASLRTATPATVSRAGILYINPADLGWNPYIASWIDTRTSEIEKANLTILFDRYIPTCLEAIRHKFKKITPISEIAHLQMLCFLLDCFLTPNNVPNDCPTEWYEIYFVFSVIWAFGSSLFQDQLIDWRNEFSKWFTNEFKAIKFPTTGNVFSYYIDQETKKFCPWSDLIPEYIMDPDIPLQATLVNTAETTRIRFFMDNLMAKRVPVMLVGAAGSGKSVIVAEKLSSLGENYAITNVPFNFYTTSEMLQRMLEKPLEKKAGRVYGPPGSKTMVYFIDDMNMPEVDKYFTVQPHTLIRQYMDYQHWYDRQKMTLRDIHNVQFVSCMNPTAGSFTINPRLQRHFCVFAVSFPSQEASQHIYHSLLSQHVTDANKFNKNVQRLCDSVVNAALSLHGKVASSFLPTAVKFHYTFTLRDMSNVFQGMLFTTGDSIQNQSDFIRLWMHESQRVYGDKLVEKRDLDLFYKLLNETVKKSFEELDDYVVFETPLIYCHFAEGIGDPKYFPITSFDHLSRLLHEALSSYNDLVAAMNLVLFEDAMYHVCRINRIMESPRGNALLVGVGGSGKQSLARLAAFISSFEVFQVQLKKGYSMNDLKADLAVLYIKSGLRSVGIVFLMTDAQVPQESFLVLINDMLASGEISELLPDEDVENVINTVRTEVKGIGQQDTRENCWKFFIDRVRRLLKIILCFSPVGSTLRIRGRKFPALVNCTSIDWFHEWPQEALQSVSKRFLSEIEVLPKELVNSVSLYMSNAHSVVNKLSEAYLLNEKRYNYTTPKSFLEQISLYSKLLNDKAHAVIRNIERLENGLLKLASTSEEADGLKEVLAVQEVELNAKNQAATELVAVLSVENEKVAKEKVFTTEEEAKVRVFEEDVAVKQKICFEDLAKAEPALIAAKEALNTLNKNNLTELKSFPTPPAAVANVTAAVLVLFSKSGKIPKDRSWTACKAMMGKVDQFLSDLINYDKDNMAVDVVKAVQEYVRDPEFNPEKIRAKSLAAAGLCAWVLNILKYYDVFVVVEPKRKAFQKADQELTQARLKLVELKEKLNYLEQQYTIVKSKYDAALDDKMKCQAEADATALKIDLANRLITGLSSENVRWRESVKRYKESIITLPGDVLLVTSFISYVGCFTRKYRIDMIEKYWMPFLLTLDPPIPMTENIDLLSLLVDDAQVAEWNNEGLPNDRMSTENACILMNSSRWPLMIDPQLQGIKWIKTKYGEQLTVVRLSMRNYLDTIERCISNGRVILLENIGESVDAVLEPVLGRVLIKKGRCMKIGDKEVDYHPKFRMILHTKLANPHYKPEIQAQTTLINFTVTRDGLEEQLLGEVVKVERPDLEQLKSSLTKQQNDFKITLKRCEDNLLYRLSSATGNILGDVELVENLETTKRMATEIEIKVKESKVTSVKIDEAREQYRPCATRASIIYFILNDLCRINAIYQFSLKAFTVVFKDALSKAVPAEKLKDRVVNLLDSITFSVFMYTCRGLFERDKLTFMAQMAFQILLHNEEIHPEELDFLLRFPIVANLNSPVDFLSNYSWGGVKALSGLNEFKGFDKDVEGSAKRWRKFVDSENPEKEKYPGEWKNKSALQKLCMMRCLRPDRMTYAIRCFIEDKLGSKYITARTVAFEKSYEETSSSTPVFFILSPGVDPLKDVEKMGKVLGFTADNRNFHSISLGQGQEIVAENAMDLATTDGHWVILQNIHLVAKWLANLEKKMEYSAEHAHTNFRLFLSAEPDADPSKTVIPQGILESSIKITNEPPTGMFANLHKALDNFNQETLEMCSKETEFKAFLFALCYFHAVVAERRKFGPQGWNRNYPFNVGDLMISVNVLYNYLENNSKIPFEDLRYLFGEIMYGGHITDDWDRRLCRTYLSVYMQPELTDGDLEFAPGFPAPPNLDFVGYHTYIDDRLPPESPYLYGLHPNAEIGFLTSTSENMFKTIFEMQPRDTGASAGIGLSREDKVKQMIEDILDRLTEEFNVHEMMAKVEDRTPYIVVAFQECERMNILTREMRRSLKELELGLKGELTITSDMEILDDELFMDQVPLTWASKAYPSMLPLGQWIADLNLRIKELYTWVTDFSMPPTVWLGGFFNPQSFLTAIMQQTARKNEWPLDKMCLLTDVTKKQKEDFTAPPREGANVHGLFMEGARWDIQQGSIADSKLKELFPIVPVVYIKAITQDKQDLRNMYDCPVYKTRQRGPTFVWTFNLKTKEKPSKWTLAGVAILLQI